MKKFLFLAILITTSACGFKPLYLQNTETEGFFSKDTSIIKQMASIKIDPIPNRLGQKIRNALLDSITPLGQAQNPQYTLVVNEVVETETEQALRHDITATRIKVKYVTDYELLNKDYKSILKDSSVSYSSFDVLSNPYSSTMSRIKAEEEVASIIANDITLRIGSYFHSLNPKKDN